MNRRRLLAIAKPLFGLSMLAYVLTKLELGELSRLWATGERWLLVTGGLCFLLSFGLLQALRLHVLVRRYTGGLSGSLQLFAIGAFFNNFLPSNVGGDAVRLVYLRDMRPGHWAAPLSLLLLHRLSGIISLWMCAALYALVQWDQLRAQLAGGAAIDLSVPDVVLWGVPGALGLGLLLLRVTTPGRRVAAKLRAKFAGPWGQCRRALGELTAGDMAWLLVTTLAFHVGRALALQLTLRFLGYDLPLLSLLPVLAVVAVVMVLPVTVGGLGLLEGTIAGMLTLYGVPAAAGASAALVNRVALVVLAAIGGVVYVSRRDVLARAKAQPPGGEGSA